MVRVIVDDTKRGRRLALTLKAKDIQDFLRILREQLNDPDITGVELVKFGSVQVEDLDALKDEDVIRTIRQGESGDQWISFNVGGKKYSTFIFIYLEEDNFNGPLAK